MKFLFPQFKTKAVTFSYDDGTVEDNWLANKFRQYNVKATFNLNSGLFGLIQDFNHVGYDVHMVRIDRKWAKDIYDGFEVASHMYTHVGPVHKADEIREPELLKDLDELEKIFGKRPDGFAYPGGGFDEESIEFLKKHNIRYARTIQSTKSFELPDNFLAWHPTCHDRDNSLELTKKFIDSTFDEPKLLYIWGHSFEFQKQDFNRYENVENILKTVSGKDDIWYATNGEIEKYVTAARNVIKKDGKYINNSGIEIFIEDDGKRFTV